MNSTVSKTLSRKASGHGSNLPFALFFLLRACPVRGRSMRTSLYRCLIPGTTWGMIPKFTTSSSFPKGFILQVRPWLVPWGAESWLGLARTPWVLGFFSGRGKPLVLWGGTGECSLEKRERELPELLTVLAVNLKENYLLDLCVVSSTRSGECRFPRAKFARGQTVPRTEASAAGEHQRVWCARRRRSTLPFHGAGLLGLNASEGQLWKGGEEEKNEKGKNLNKKEQKSGRKIIYSNLEYWHYWNKLIFMYSPADLICIWFQFPGEIG